MELEKYMIRNYGLPKQYKDPRADKTKDHRRRGGCGHFWRKEKKPARKEWHRINRRKAKSAIHLIMKTGDFDKVIPTLKRTSGWWTH